MALHYIRQTITRTTKVKAMDTPAAEYMSRSDIGCPLRLSVTLTRQIGKWF
jgi:hypothetical protein